MAAIRKLPAAQREAVALHYLADLPIHEVAEATGSPVGTVKSRLSRGRAALAVLLADLPDSSEARHGCSRPAPSARHLPRRSRRRPATRLHGCRAPRHCAATDPNAPRGRCSDRRPRRRRQRPAGDGPIEPGTYLVPSAAWSAVDYTVTFPEGWDVQYGYIYRKHGEQPAELGFRPAVVNKVYADACRGEAGAQKAVGPSSGTARLRRTTSSSCPTTS
jgi:hypothetical protein